MNKIDEELFDAMVKKASERLANKISDEYPSPEELQGKYTYSPEFEMWVKNQIKRSNFHFRNQQLSRLLKGIYGVSKQVAAACCVIFVFLTLTAFSVPPIRIALMNFIVQQNDNFVSINVNPTDVPNIQDGSSNSDPEHGIPYVPKGFEASDVVENDVSLMITYVNNNNETIWLERDSGSIGQTFDNESSQYEKINISGHDVYYIYKSGINTFVFRDADGSYNYKITSGIKKDDLLKMVQHILEQK